ncbi:MAG: HD domain-containing protein [Patescibacteria group bacterium]|jgi:hypothetical protein
MKLIYAQIWKEAAHFLKKGRKWDYLHTKIIIRYAEKLSKLNNIDGMILMPAVILHDIGWGVLPKKLKINYRGKQARLAHMRAGAKLARQILLKINFPRQYISEIVHLVGVHDLPSESIGGILTAKYERLLRDIDLLWRFTKEGFWKDIRERKIEDPDVFLKHIIASAKKEKAFGFPGTKAFFRKLIKGLEKEIKEEPTVG